MVVNQWYVTIYPKQFFMSCRKNAHCLKMFLYRYWQYFLIENIAQHSLKYWNVFTAGSNISSSELFLFPIETSSTSIIPSYHKWRPKYQKRGIFRDILKACCSLPLGCGLPLLNSYSIISLLLVLPLFPLYSAVFQLTIIEGRTTTRQPPPHQ